MMHNKVLLCSICWLFLPHYACCLFVISLLYCFCFICSLVSYHTIVCSLLSICSSQQLQPENSFLGGWSLLLSVWTFGGIKGEVVAGAIQLQCQSMKNTLHERCTCWIKYASVMLYTIGCTCHLKNCILCFVQSLANNILFWYFLFLCLNCKYSVLLF